MSFYPCGNKSFREILPPGKIMWARNGVLYDIPYNTPRNMGYSSCVCNGCDVSALADANGRGFYVDQLLENGRAITTIMHGGRLVIDSTCLLLMVSATAHPDSAGSVVFYK